MCLSDCYQLCVLPGTAGSILIREEGMNMESKNEGRWIIVTGAEKKERYAVNTDNINYIHELPDGHAVISFADYDLQLHTEESFDMIGEMIK